MGSRAERKSSTVELSSGQADNVKEVRTAGTVWVRQRRTGRVNSCHGTRLAEALCPVAPPTGKVNALKHDCIVQRMPPLITEPLPWPMIHSCPSA